MCFLKVRPVFRLPAHACPRIYQYSGVPSVRCPKRLWPPLCHSLFVCLSVCVSVILSVCLLIASSCSFSLSMTSNLSPVWCSPFFVKLGMWWLLSLVKYPHYSLVADFFGLLQFGWHFTSFMKRERETLETLPLYIVLSILLSFNDLVILTKWSWARVESANRLPPTGWPRQRQSIEEDWYLPQELSDLKRC